jgi:hypothetical protein
MMKLEKRGTAAATVARGNMGRDMRRKEQQHIELNLQVTLVSWCDRKLQLFDYVGM